jgi:hypothetical protein
MGKKIVRQLEATFQRRDGSEFTFLCMTVAPEDAVGYLTHCWHIGTGGAVQPFMDRSQGFPDVSALGQDSESHERSEQKALGNLGRRMEAQLTATERHLEVELKNGGTSRLIVRLRPDAGADAWGGWVSGPFQYVELSAGQDPPRGFLAHVPPGRRVEAEERAIAILDEHLTSIGSRRTGRPC